MGFAFLTFLFRILTGIINKSGYEKDEFKTVAYTLLAVSVTMLHIVFDFTFWTGLVALSLVLALAFNCFSFIMPPEKLLRWEKNKTLWKLLTNGLYISLMLLLGADLIGVALLLYPALFISNAVVNSAFGKDWFWSDTGNLCGNTFRLHFAQEIRFFLAMISLALLLLNTFFVHFHCTIFDLIK